MTQLTLFLCGDVMTGRGIDQILAHPSEPAIHEICMRSATTTYGSRRKRAGPYRAPRIPHTSGAMRSGSSSG